jgi:hypothetical protein
MTGDVESLAPLVGEWDVTIHGYDARGRTTFEWLEGGGYLIQRSTVDDPRFPNAVMAIGPDAAGERLVQHYFDSRGVARVYDVSLEGDEFRLWRDGPDFAQRLTARFNAERTELRGAFERVDESGTWIHDFDITYTKVR